MNFLSKSIFVVLFAVISSAVFGDVMKHHLSGACVSPLSQENNALLLFDYDGCNPKSLAEVQRVSFIQEKTGDGDGSFYIKNPASGYCIGFEGEAPQQGTKLVLSSACNRKFLRTPSDAGKIELKGSNLVIQSNQFMPRQLDNSGYLILANKSRISRDMFLAQNQIFLFEVTMPKNSM
ncbi:hypothetical protein [Zooshikella harenae]|uniref:Ricin B lectin domain-containing protein n=1 Tax=Zooshikella harenae TaxID=2827238 RepID=A0ABS5ZJA5_9GAMM|nr:hypothetical protein [Zooshikella harenae]MBU2713310.1 hypothetical protein [Zooshikella harenae]